MWHEKKKGDSSMGLYKKGIASISFRNHTPEEILLASKKAGLDCVEWGSDFHAPYNDLESLKKLVTLQDELGIYCSSYGTYFKIGVSNIEELKEYISAAKILGTDTIRVFCGNKRCDRYPKKEKAFIISECKRVAEIAQKSNVTVCLERHNNSYTETIEGALELMETINSPNFLMYWQPNQFVPVEENIKYAKMIAQYVKNIHVFNWSYDDRCSLSEGVDTWVEYLEYFENDKILLLEFMPDDSLDSLEKEVVSLCEITKRMER